MKVSVRSIRTAHRYTVEEMAVILGISAKTYRLYERRPAIMPAHIAIRLAAVGHLSVDDIFFG